MLVIRLLPAPSPLPCSPPVIPGPTATCKATRPRPPAAPAPAPRGRSHTTLGNSIGEQERARSAQLRCPPSGPYAHMGDNAVTANRSSVETTQAFRAAGFTARGDAVFTSCTHRSAGAGVSTRSPSRARTPGHSGRERNSMARSAWGGEHGWHGERPEVAPTRRATADESHWCRRRGDRL
jgi:hypothetical protein